MKTNPLKQGILTKNSAGASAMPSTVQQMSISFGITITSLLKGNPVPSECLIYGRSRGFLDSSLSTAGWLMQLFVKNALLLN